MGRAALIWAAGFFFRDANANSGRIVSDPLHFLGRIRYRLLSSDFTIGVNENLKAFSRFYFQMAAQVPPVVFDNARITKMHNSLPVQLFSRQPIVAAFEGCQGEEFFCFIPLVSDGGWAHSLRAVNGSPMQHV
jgi:hypothetical protein